MKNAKNPLLIVALLGIAVLLGACTPAVSEPDTTETLPAVGAETQTMESEDAMMEEESMESDELMMEEEDTMMEDDESMEEETHSDDAMTDDKMEQ